MQHTFSFVFVSLLSAAITALLMRARVRSRSNQTLFWMEKSNDFLRHPPHHDRFYVINCEEDLRTFVLRPIEAVFSLSNSSMTTAQAMEHTIALLKASRFDATLNGIVLHYLNSVKNGVDFAQFQQILSTVSKDPVKQKLFQELITPETARRIIRVGTSLGVNSSSTGTAPNAAAVPVHTA